MHPHPPSNSACPGSGTTRPIGLAYSLCAATQPAGWRTREGWLAIAGRHCAILLKEPSSCGSLVFSNSNAVVDDVLHLLGHLLHSFAIEPDFAIEGEDATGFRCVQQ